MHTIVETATFVRHAAEAWSEDGLMDFKLWLAMNPQAGGVIYFNQLADGVIALLMVYTKAKFDNLPAAFLLQLKQEFEHDPNETQSRR